MKDKNYVQMLCTHCKKIYQINYGTKYFYGLVLMLLSFSMFTFVIDEGSFSFTLTSGFALTMIGLLIAIILGAFGAKFLMDISKKERDCRVCHGKKALIAIDTPKAIEIIKENNLSIPEPVIDQKFPWQTN